MKPAETQHPTDERLVARYFDGQAGDEGLELHLFRCRTCAARRDAIAAALDADHDDVLAAADRSFPPARLARQRDAILHRLARRPSARVLPFPAAPSSIPALQRAVRRSSRWTAAAAALILSVSAGTGWWLDRGASGSSRVQAESVTMALGPAGHEYQDTLLSEIDVALARPGTAELEVLDALTPRAGEQLIGH